MGRMKNFLFFIIEYIPSFRNFIKFLWVINSHIEVLLGFDWWNLKK